jgi:NADH-quinone oxidoreductase subunit B
MKDDPPDGNLPVARLNSEKILKIMDDIIITGVETVQGQELFEKSFKPILDYLQRSSYFGLHFGIMCCALEMAVTSASRYDAQRFGVIYRSSPRQTDVLLVLGPVSRKLAPKLVTLYEQMPEPKWTIAMGECAISGGPFWESYATIGGVDQIIPIDIYIPGCPARPEALINGFLELQKKIKMEQQKAIIRRKLYLEDE